MDGISKKVFVVVVIILLLLIFGSAFGIWYFLDKQTDSLVRSKNNRISELEKQIKTQNNKIDDLEEDLRAYSPTSVCDPEGLTASESSEIEDWTVYVNDTYNYCFLYPKTWQKSSNSTDDLISINYSQDEIILEIKSGGIISPSFEKYTQEDEQAITIAEVDSKLYFLQKNEDKNIKIIYVKFEKNANDFLFSIQYEYKGVSDSEDIIDIYKLILKTITFG